MEARLSKSGRSTRGLASGRSRHPGWRWAWRSPPSFGGRSRRAIALSARTNTRRRNDLGLLRDWNYIEKAVHIPALSEVIRETLIRALFVRDDRVLTRDIIADLKRVPHMTEKVKDDGDVRNLARLQNVQS